jgi:hypothetical protein
VVRLRSVAGPRAILAGMLGVALLGPALLGACGAGGGAPATVPPTVPLTVPPARWAADVCTALTPWRARIVSLNAQAQQQVAAATAPDQARAGLLELLQGAETASETARVAVATAGAPAGNGGEAIASYVTNSLATIRDAYARARRDLESVPVGDADAFYDRVVAVFDRLNRDYLDAAPDLGRVNLPDLRRAFDEVAECR